MKRTLTVRGIFDPPEQNPLLADVSMSQQGFDEAFKRPKNSFTFIDAPAGAKAALDVTANDFDDATLHTGAAFPNDATKDQAVVFAMLYVLLGFSVIVSLFGMVNTMILSVFERTREIGMLRTIGMTRRQARRMIRHESVITALIGASMGLGLGLFLALARDAGGTDAEALPSRFPLAPLVGLPSRVLAGMGRRSTGTASVEAEVLDRPSVR